MTAASLRRERFLLPRAAQFSRRIGPFDATTLPKGLLREHRLKEKAWARLTVLSGALNFVWDDRHAAWNAVPLGAGQTIDVPPLVPHHLEPAEGEFELAIEFHSEP